MFKINNKNYTITHNGEYYVVIDEKGQSIIGVSNPDHAEECTRDYLEACREYTEKVFL